MTNNTESENRTKYGQSDRDVRTVRYEVVDERSDLYQGEEVDFSDMLRAVWSQKITIAVGTLIAIFISITYAFLATEVFRAETVLAPADDSASPSGLLSQFGALANLGGISLGDNSSTEAVAVLRSRDFARSFINDFDLLPKFFADDWDSETESWTLADKEDWPDVRDGVKYFHEEVLEVDEDVTTGLVTITIEWEEREESAEWANVLVERLNRRMRDRAMTKAEKNIAYLWNQLENTDVLTLQQSIGRLLEVELQKLMLARGSEEYAFKVIDIAHPPRKRSWPKRALIVVLGTVIGGLFSLVFVLIRGGLQRGQEYR